MSERRPVGTPPPPHPTTTRGARIGLGDPRWDPRKGGAANLKRRSVAGGHRLARGLGGALGEGYLGADGVGAHLPGGGARCRDTRLGGRLTLCGWSRGARGGSAPGTPRALLPTARIRYASRWPTPQGGGLPLSARFLPVRLWRRTLSKFFLFFCSSLFAFKSTKSSSWRHPMGIGCGLRPPPAPRPHPFPFRCGAHPCAPAGAPVPAARGPGLVTAAFPEPRPTAPA